MSKERICPWCHSPDISFSGPHGEVASCGACQWTGRPVELAYKPTEPTEPTESRAPRPARHISGYTPFEIGLGFGFGFAVAHGLLGVVAALLYLLAVK